MTGPMTDASDPLDPPTEKPKTREQLDADAELQIRSQYVLALRACKSNERKWLKCLLECEGLPYEAGRMAGVAKSTVHRWLRLPRTQYAFKVIEAMLTLEIGVNAFILLREYRRQALSKLRDAYYPKGHANQGQLKPPHEWDDDLAAAISEHTFDKDGRPTVKMHGKGPALDALVRLRNLGPPQRLELTGANGEPLNTGVPVITFARYSDEVETPAPDGDAKLDKT